MPRGKIVREEDPLIERLTEQLKAEWKNESSEASEPVIIEQGSAGFGMNPAIHIYVIWSDWGSLDQQERSEVIMNAYEAANGRDKTEYVTFAMGLTPKEASKMGIRYEVVGVPVA